jgi:hypothetical protein
MKQETKTMPSFPAASEEIVWLRALHAVELCREVAELAARVHQAGWAGLAWPVAAASAASSAG